MNDNYVLFAAAKLTETIVTDGSEVAAITASASRAPAPKSYPIPVESASPAKKAQKKQKLKNKFDVSVTSSTSSFREEQVKRAPQQVPVVARVTSTPKHERRFEKSERMT